MLLFKYLSPDGVSKVFAEEGNLCLRFGLPRSYTDPYELFLQTDQLLDSDQHRAFYEYLCEEIPQFPVTCFSKRPNSVAMWAHYARENLGACLVFDEDSFTSHFSVAYVDDVVYSSVPAHIRASAIESVIETGDRRRARRVLAEANRAAYFVKRIEWQYESERRIVVLPSEVTPSEDYYVAPIRPQALRFIVLGAKAHWSVRKLCETRGREFAIPTLELRVGKRLYEPFFVGGDGVTSIWNGTELLHVDCCRICREPCFAIEEDDLCDWCRMDERSSHAPSAGIFKHYSRPKPSDRLEFADLLPKGRLIEKQGRSTDG